MVPAAPSATVAEAKLLVPPSPRGACANLAGAREQLAGDRRTGGLVVEPIDLLDGDFYVNDPYPTYAWMREHAPAYWDETNELWGISRYDDIVEIEKRKDLFINSDQAKGGYRPNIPADPAIIGLDDPLHQRATQPGRPTLHPAGRRHVGGPRPRVVTPAARRGAGPGGPGRRRVVELAAPLPAEMIGLLLGFGRADVAEAPGLVRADDRARRRTPLPRRGRDRRGDGVRRRSGRAVRGRSAPARPTT